jgi:hypothetical protein
MILINLAILAGIAGIVWWLTGNDKNISGESMRDQYLARALRCLSIMLIVTVLLWSAEGDNRFGGIAVLEVLAFILALLLRSSVSEFFAHGFFRFLDPALHDSRELDLKRTQRHQDAIAHLIHNGHTEQAIKLCEELKESGELDRASLEATLEFLGVKQERPAALRPVTAAARLRAEGKFAEAEQQLMALLAKNPADADAAMLLMRLYAENLSQPGKAAAVLRALEKQPHVAAAHIEFARRSIDGWSRGRPEKTGPVRPPASESVEELLAQGFFGSAIELLEQKISAQPGSFDLRLQLAEIQAVHCHNFPRAEKIIRQLEADPQLTPAQTATARARLKEWRETRLQRK